MINLREHQNATAQAVELLTGGQLDQLKISSIFLCLGFYFKNRGGKPSSYLWLNISGHVHLMQNHDSKNSFSGGVDDFYKFRLTAISELYSSIGEVCSKVSVFENGEMRIDIGQKSFVIVQDGDDEESWVICGERYQSDESEWYLAYQSEHGVIFNDAKLND